jgi:hypothetical protein
VAPRDLKPQNLVLARAAGGEEALVLVDLDDVGLRPPEHADVLRNLAGLDAYAQLAPRPPGVGARLRALRAYAAARGLDPAPLLGEALRASRAKQRLLRARLRALRAGGAG